MNEYVDDVQVRNAHAHQELNNGIGSSFSGAAADFEDNRIDARKFW